MAVRMPRVRIPSWRPRETRRWARASERSSSWNDEPLPALTSSTSAASPSACFLDRIEEAMRGTDSTVAVALRSP